MGIDAAANADYVNNLEAQKRAYQRQLQNINRQLEQLPGTIATYYNHLNKANEIGETIRAKLAGLTSKLDAAKTFLEEELVIIQEWQTNVDSVKANIDDFALDEYEILKDVFVEDIDSLQESAQKFLDRPNNVFGDDNDDEESPEETF